MVEKDENGVDEETKKLFQKIKQFQSRRPSAQQSTESSTEQKDQTQTPSEDKSKSNQS